MLYLAMKTREGERMAQASEISESQDIPPHYLKQILARLRAAGLLRSTRGPAGGHELARDASEITVADIIRCLEGNLTSVNAILDMPCHIQVGSQHCVIKEFLVGVKTVIEELLTAKTLADLAQRQHVLSTEKILVQPRIMRR